MPFNRRPRVLYVDDSPDNCEMLSKLLELAQIETQIASTATEALSAIQAERFDLYLLEAWLPDVNGFELCRQMRSNDQRTPILFFSAAAYDSDKKRGIAAGADAYLTKPDIDGLLGSVTHYVSQTRVAATA